MGVRHFTIEDIATWYQHTDRQIFLGGVLDETNSDTMSVGFGRYKKGESNAWVVTYDEVNIVTKGAFTFRTADGEYTARAGEILFITKGTWVVYEAPEYAEFIYVTYPHWMNAQKQSEHAGMLDAFHRTS